MGSVERCFISGIIDLRLCRNFWAGRPIGRRTRRLKNDRLRFCRKLQSCPKAPANVNWVGSIDYNVIVNLSENLVILLLISQICLSKNSNDRQCTLALSS